MEHVPGSGLHVEASVPVPDVGCRGWDSGRKHSTRNPTKRFEPYTLNYLDPKPSRGLEVCVCVWLGRVSVMQLTDLAFSTYGFR